LEVAEKLCDKVAIISKGRIVFFGDMDEIKTKDFKIFLESVGAAGKALVVTPEVNRNVVLSARNLPGVKTTFASLLSTYDIMDAKTFVVDKAALSTIEEVYA
jgi:large subunit ribosomal protein L4